MGSTHYSLAQNTGDLLDWAQNRVPELQTLLQAQRGKIKPVLCYSGMSGIAHATALAFEWYKVSGNEDIEMMYVRKQNEESHGREIEYNVNTADKHSLVFVFVDDLISTGRTLDYVLEKCKDWCKYHHRKYRKTYFIQCLGGSVVKEDFPD